MSEPRVELRSTANGELVVVTPDHPLWPMIDTLVIHGAFTREDEKPKKSKRKDDEA
jgi:hypothetical protein